MKRFKLSVPVLFACLLAGCAAAAVIAIIDAIASTAITAAEASGVLPPAYVAYADAGIACGEAAVTELDSTDSPGVQAAAIALACGKAASAFIPAGLPANLEALAIAVGQEVDQLLMQEGAAKTELTRKSVTVSMPQPNILQRHHLRNLGKKLAAARAKLHAGR